LVIESPLVVDPAVERPHVGICRGHVVDHQRFDAQAERRENQARGQALTVHPRQACITLLEFWLRRPEVRSLLDGARSRALVQAAWLAHHAEGVVGAQIPVHPVAEYQATGSVVDLHPTWCSMGKLRIGVSEKRILGLVVVIVGVKEAVPER
jgi:hypothetical protein